MNLYCSSKCSLKFVPQLGAFFSLFLLVLTLYVGVVISSSLPSTSEKERHTAIKCLTLWSLCRLKLGLFIPLKMSLQPWLVVLPYHSAYHKWLASPAQSLNIVSFGLQVLWACCLIGLACFLTSFEPEVPKDFHVKGPGIYPQIYFWKYFECLYTVKSWVRIWFNALLCIIGSVSWRYHGHYHGQYNVTIMVSIMSLSWSV